MQAGKFAAARRLRMRAGTSRCEIISVLDERIRISGNSSRVIVLPISFSNCENFSIELFQVRKYRNISDHLADR